MAAALNLESKTALITGAGSGIGRGIALRLAQDGARVILAGRRIGPLEETRAVIAEKVGADMSVCAVHQLDVTDRESINAAFEAIADQFQSLDILVNNAGATGVNELEEESQEDCWERVIRTNLDGMYWVTKAALRLMPDGGRIINIGSVLSHRAAPGSSAYVASKHGVIGLTRSLAIDFSTPSRRITVNAICPGWVKTAMADGIIAHMAGEAGKSQAEIESKIRKGIPMGRMVEAEEVGALAAFLASDDAAMITGQAITICGGSSLV